ncbi:MAG: aminopeptidase P family N-terminal domain-containing protein, partial [Holosporales bacterium]|nr:aminopeptidase P family N-terminal domain-containing protein [Holosporales bacterium]
MLEKLRTELAKAGSDAIFIAINNSFGNFDKEVSWLTQISGFTGSNGRAIITATEAVLCVDGRYTKQASDQVDNSSWQICMYPDANTITILSRVMKANQTLSVGPFSVTYGSYMSMLQLSKQIGFKIEILESTSFDAVN